MSEEPTDSNNPAQREYDDISTFFCQNAGYMCEHCRKHKYKHLGDDLRCPSSSQRLCAVSDLLKDPKYLADVKALEAFVAGDCGHGQVVQNGCPACERKVGYPLEDDDSASSDLAEAIRLLRELREGVKAEKVLTGRKYVGLALAISHLLDRFPASGFAEPKS